MSQKVVIVEDDVQLLSLIARKFDEAGYVTITAETYASAKAKVEQLSVDLLVLDWVLPDNKNGIELASLLKGKVPTIVISAKDNVKDEIQAFDTGAVDYLSKPFDISVLVKRASNIIALTKNNLAPAPKAGVFVSGDIEVNELAKAVKFKDKAVSLTKSEYFILTELLKKEGQVLSREELMKSFLGNGINVSLRTVDTHVYTLRKKLDDTERIETVRGFGYKLSQP
jgi:DNA-binding response OmpR family regulator